MKRILQILTVFSYLAVSTTTVVSCQISSRSSGTDNENENREAERAYRKLSRYLDEDYYLEILNVKEVYGFLNTFFRDDKNFNVTENIVVTKDSYADNRFTLDFKKANGSINMYFGNKTDINEKIKNPNFGELDFNFTDENQMKEFLTQSYDFLSFINSDDYITKILTNTNYNYFNGMKVDLTGENIKNKSLDFYKNKYGGKLEISFSPKMRIDKFFDYHVGSISNISSEKIYNYYSTKPGFSNLYSEYKITEKDFKVEDVEEGTLISSDTKLIGSHLLNADRKIYHNLDEINLKSVINSKGIPEENEIAWTDFIYKTISEKFKVEIDELKELIKLNMNLNDKTFKVEPKNTNEQSILVFEGSWSGKLFGAKHANEVIKNTQLGIISTDDLKLESGSFNSRNIIKFIESRNDLDNYQSLENNISFKNDSKNNNKIVIQFLIPTSISKDFLVGEITFSYTLLFSWSGWEYENTFNQNLYRYFSAITINSNYQNNLVIWSERENSSNKKILYYESNKNPIEIEMGNNFDNSKIKAMYSIEFDKILFEMTDGFYIINMNFEEVTYNKFYENDNSNLSIKSVKKYDEDIIFSNEQGIFKFGEDKVEKIIENYSVNYFDINDNILVFITTTGSVYYKKMDENSINFIKEFDDTGFVFIKNNTIHIISKTKQNTWTYWLYEISSKTLSDKPVYLYIPTNLKGAYMRENGELYFHYLSLGSQGAKQETYGLTTNITKNDSTLEFGVNVTKLTQTIVEGRLKGPVYLQNHSFETNVYDNTVFNNHYISIIEDRVVFTWLSSETDQY
ncbi:hypothetical protein SCHIN_v1c06750 [Spiroplasma chinense]|uniref:Lipoprotein n=1 Tax=Spiroplasma chinense TaxID=216932 RepID=A0A5B9Y703_9MOLU|nr:hypothetical protein [Spiroplasma chinense]QEH61872.1 hypothetical protein SCHIN_v1c06750 [Spiroplasma chinense]